MELIKLRLTINEKRGFFTKEVLEVSEAKTHYTIKGSGISINKKKILIPLLIHTNRIPAEKIDGYHKKLDPFSYGLVFFIFCRTSQFKEAEEILLKKMQQNLEELRISYKKHISNFKKLKS